MVRGAGSQRLAGLGQRDRLGVGELGVGGEFGLDLDRQRVQGGAERFDAPFELGRRPGVLLATRLAQHVCKLLVQHGDLVCIMQVMVAGN